MNKDAADRTPPAVHAVIVHHRGEEMLGRCLETLLASEDVALEVVLVKNRCLEPLPVIVEDEPRIHVVVSETSLGFSEANNLGVGWARAHLGDPEYYYFVNNDTESYPDSLALLVAALRARPQAAMAGPKLLILGAEDHYNSLGINVTEDGWGWDEGIGIAVADYGEVPPTRPVITVTGSALLINAAVFHAIGGWTEVYDYYFEDIDLAIKVWKHGREVIHVPESVVRHQISATMTEGSERKHFFFWRNRLMLALIHWPRSLLWRTLRRAVVDEIWRTPKTDNALQRRALRGALAKLPRLLRLRFALRGGDDAWRKFLVPPGSVPVITLPEIGAADAEPEETPSEPEEPAPPAETWRAAAALSPATGGRRVLVLGWAPLPFEDARMNYAPGGRSWQLARPLAADGHAVCLVCARIPGAYRDDVPAVAETRRDGVLVFHLERATFERGRALEDLIAAFGPEVVVGAAAVPSGRAAELAGERPLWVDLFGDPMAEAQARAAAHQSGDQLTAYWRLLRRLLERGDAFAAVSEHQRYAVLGQLGLAGRLNRATAGVELVHVVPCSPPPDKGRDQTEPARLDGVAADDFVIAWSGGYNTWCDVDTLFAGLERAMRRCPELRFVSTGGAIEGQDQETYRRFETLIQASELADRFLLLGFVPHETLDAVLRRADLGVVTEKPLVERVLGSSGRVLEWLARGVPVLCTDVSELGATLAAKRLARVYPAADAEALAAEIVAAAADRDGLRATALAAREYAHRELSAEVTTRPLRRWARTATRAPDAGEAPRYLVPRQRYLDLVDRVEQLETARRAAESRGDHFETRYHDVRRELGELHQSKMWRLWMASVSLRRWLGLRKG